MTATRSVLLAARLGLLGACAMFWPGPAGAGQPVLVPPGRALDAAMLEDLIRQDLQPPGEGVWTVRIISPSLPMTNPSDDDLSVGLARSDAASIDPDADSVRVQGDLQVRDRSGHAASLPFSAELRAMVEIPVPVRPIAPGTVLDETMVEATWLARDRLDDGVLRSLDEVRDREVAKRLPAGRQIVRTALRTPRAVRRGEPVLITLVKGGLRLTVTGRALEDGALGEIVRANNPASSRDVQGVVSAPGEVTLGGPVP